MHNRPPGAVFPGFAGVLIYTNLLKTDLCMCESSTSASLPCTFNVPQKQGGNRGPRATTLNQLRKEYTSSSTPIRTEGELDRNHARNAQEHTIPPLSSTGGLGPTDLEALPIEACIEAYLDRIHPIVPLLNEDLLRDEVSKASISPASKQFVLSFCAYVVTFGKVLREPSASPSLSSTTAAATSISDFALGQQLVDSALAIQNPQRITQPSGLSVYISFFLYGAHAGMGMYRPGWFYLREATTLFMMQKPGEKEWFTPETHTRVFWILVVSERAHAIRRQRPITLQINPSTPPPPPPLTPPDRSLHHLATLFRPFDESFFSLWNDASRRDCSKDWLLSLETRVRTALLPPLSLLDDLSCDQLANVRVSQLWLQGKLYELFPRFGFLSSRESVYECLTFGYPVAVAGALLDHVGGGEVEGNGRMTTTTRLPARSLWVHGVGMTEKIFDITCALTDVFPFLPPHLPSTTTHACTCSATSSSQPTSPSIPHHPPEKPLQHLRTLTKLLSTLPSGREKFVPLLLAKIRGLLQPCVVEYIAKTVEEDEGFSENGNVTFR
ncbi:unnamed protein product [Periconia digitata]|uniref:Transcription factor domain-containing protein n=1 Tax=Periconia digitata TaxID=1303443 RepID=A0A9W4UTT6_9PLEO|nr:unnamed protein product [Periconia digitata]